MPTISYKVNGNDTVLNGLLQDLMYKTPAAYVPMDPASLLLESPLTYPPDSVAMIKLLSSIFFVLIRLVPPH